MKLSTGSGDNVGRFSARRDWIPLKKGKAELMMHEIAVNCVNVTKPVRLGLPKFDHGKNQCPWFWKGLVPEQGTKARGLGKRPASVRRLEPIELWVPARALLLALEAVRTGCLTGDAGYGKKSC